MSKLIDTALNKEVPEDVYELSPKENQKAVAKCIKDWEDAQVGEYWYPYQCELTPETNN